MSKINSLTAKESQLLGHTKTFVQETLADAEGGHDWSHTLRVYNNALLIAKHETVDLLIVGLAALLHDISDAKFNGGDEKKGARIAEAFLMEKKLAPEKAAHVSKIIANVSFKGGTTERTHNSTELDVVQDADRLDALGAVGIARTFNYGGFKNRKLYDPEIPPQMEQSPETYRKSESPTINHFYEKLLLLKDRMNTETGKKIAQERHDFMETFLDRFYAEWEGRDYHLPVDALPHKRKTI
ncbi:MAG: HD domain-containing protein [Leeuwenhoekiella sp.]